MDSKRHVIYLDFVRGAAIYLVIVLHVTAETQASGTLLGTPLWWFCNVVNVISRAGVPCFFMISGYLLLSDSRTAEPWSFYKRRFQRLLIPFLFWDIVYYLLNCYRMDRSVDLHIFLRELFLQGSEYHLWFVYQIAALYLLAPFLKKIVDRSSRRQLWLFLLLILLVPTVFSLLNNVQTLVWFTLFGPLVEGYAGFFLLGYLLGAGALSPRVRRGVYALAVLSIAAGSVGNFLLSVPENMSLPFNGGYFLTQYFTGAALFLFAKTHCGNAEGRASALAHSLSGLSFGVYLSHVLVFKCLNDLLLRRGINVHSAVGILFLWAAVSVVSTLLTYMLSKLPVLRRTVT